MRKPFILLVIILSNIATSFSQEINIGITDTVYSEILEEKRAVSIYFPPSYHYKTDREYPVLYILDGDYNFTYVAGLLELQAGISENFPEMILVAISGQGSLTYRKNCKPAIEGVEDSGNASEVLGFIEKELVPFVDGKYKTLKYKILAGHSLGGLFIINAALERPKLLLQLVRQCTGQIMLWTMWLRKALKIKSHLERMFMFPWPMKRGWALRSF